MRRTLLPMLVLIAASTLTALPVIARSDEENWQIVVFAWNSGTVTSVDARYCLMPETMPIRPGNLARLQDAHGREIEVSAFLDRVELNVGKGLFRPGDPCQLQATYLSVSSQEGLRIVITPDPAPPPSTLPERVTVAPVMQTSGPYDWWYNEKGAKVCRLPGDVQLGDGAPLVIDPPARLPSGASTRTPQLQSTVTYSASTGTEFCGLTAILEFPIADEYVIEFGGRAQAESGD